MKRLRVILTCMAAGMILSACTQSATGPPSLTSTDPSSPGYSKLQLAVGMATIETNGGTVTGLNVVSTLRQPNGNSAVLVDTPTLKGPFTLPAAAPVCNPGGGESCIDPYTTMSEPPTAGFTDGPSAQEVAAGGTLEGTPQTVHPGTPPCDSATACGSIAPNTTTFGNSGGVFGMGFAPYNHTNGGVAASYVPYYEPMYDTIGNAFIPWGGPPSFDPNKDGMGTRDGTFNLGVQLAGVGEGITVLENVTPSIGTYTLSTVIPTGPSSAFTATTSATLTSTVALPPAGSPVVTLNANGDGGGIFTVEVPAGVTEGYVEIIDFGLGTGNLNCQGSIGTTAFPVYYTIHMTASGDAVLPPTDGPNTNVGGGNQNRQPSPSICSAAQNTAANGGVATPGDTFASYFIGFDYPLFAASYPQSLGVQAPVLPGASGQADITISEPATDRVTFHGHVIKLHGKLKAILAQLHR